MKTIEQLVKDEVHGLYDKNMYYENTLDKDQFVEEKINEMSKTQLLDMISEAAEEWKLDVMRVCGVIVK